MGRIHARRVNLAGARRPVKDSKAKPSIMAIVLPEGRRELSPPPSLRPPPRHRHTKDRPRRPRRPGLKRAKRPAWWQREERRCTTAGRKEGARQADGRAGPEGRRTTDEGARTTDEGARTRTRSCRGSEIEGQRTAGRTKDYAPGTAPAKDPNLNSTTVTSTVTERLPPPRGSHRTTCSILATVHLS
jgi:hypothetical protein